jgi:hypothetical protein
MPRAILLVLVVVLVLDLLSGGQPGARGWPAPPGSDGASPYRLEPRSMPRAILLVVVLDLGSTRSARLTLTARFGQSHTLPP